MPAEWEYHKSIWLSWPKNLMTFPKEILPKVEQVFIDIITAVNKSERIDLLVDDAAMESRVKKILRDAGISYNLFFHKIKSADVWVRDYGPTFVKKGDEVKVVKWTYNSLGGKYEDLKYDDQTGEDIARASGKEILRPNLVLEGGSIDVNGKGSMLTTEQCLLNKNRNSKLSKKEIESVLQKYLGVTNIIWLKEGIIGDDTDGHIDDIARFISDKTIVCAVEENKDDANYSALKKNFELLQKAKDQDGDKFEVIRLPMPGPVNSDSQRLPASYANFYIGNKVVLLPVFKDKNDQKAIDILQNCFPKRRVVPIYCEPLVWGFGTIHCSSQQQPV